MKLPIYLDHHATTPIDPRVLAEMMPFFKEEFGNPASRNHVFGRRASEAVETARRGIAKAVHALDEAEIIFTSGATESNNLAIKGAAAVYKERGNHIITSVIEHKSVLESCEQLGKEGFRVTVLPVDRNGFIRLDELKAAITDQTILISIMHANNEIGTLQPIEAIGKIAKSNGIFFHCDAVQSVGKVPVDVQAMGIDLMSFSAHKLYGPKGIAALYVRKRNPRVRLAPLFGGGGQEGGLRPGTLNVPAIVGFARAVQIAVREMPEESERLFLLREKLRKQICGALHRAYVNGGLDHRLPGNLNMSFAFVEGELLLTELAEEIAVSSGSACTHASLEPSYVLKALGVGHGLEHTSIRFGLGRFNTEEEINHAALCVIKTVNRLRKQSPLYKTVAAKENSPSGASR